MFLVKPCLTIRRFKNGIECWKSEGFVSGDDQGYEVISKLVRACFLTEDYDNNNTVKMHDVVREMVLWVASYSGKQKEGFIAQAGVGLLEVPQVKDWSSVRKLSLMNNEIEKISCGHRCPQLTTLLLQQNRNLVHISGEFFQYMPRLAVLNMSFNELKELPQLVTDKNREITGWCWKVETSEISQFGNGIFDVPERVKSIDEMFDVQERVRNVDGIYDIPSLVVLRLLHSKFSLDVRTIEELKFLNTLESLSIDISSSSALEQLLSDNRLAFYIEEVCIRDLQEEAYRTLVLPTMGRLRKLIIRSCEIWEIEIGRTSRDTFLTRPKLNNLSSVIITGCIGLKDLTWLLFVPNLTNLKLQSLEKVEEIISQEKAASSITDEQKERGGASLFQKHWIPLLFPCLKKIEVERCPKLRRLPLNSESCIGGEEVVINYRDDEWIERVRWQDKATKDRFLPCCEKLMPPYSRE